MTDINTKTEPPLSARFLVIDDSKTMLDEMCRILSTMGYTDITSVPEGTSAWTLILKQTELGKPFDVILCDWNMPGHLSGIQLLENVRTTPAVSSTVFILVTTENTFDKVKRALALNVSNYIIKPYDSKDVALKLQSTWKKRKLAPT